MNTPATGILQTGTYSITNARNRNNIIIPDDRERRAPLVARSDLNSPNSKWNVTLLNNGKYNIINYQYPTRSASVPAIAAEGEEVVAITTRVQQWDIRETSTRGNYIISNLEGEYFWGLADNQEETAVRSIC